jgi:hypothetical protein
MINVITTDCAMRDSAEEHHKNGIISTCAFTVLSERYKGEMRARIRHAQSATKNIFVSCNENDCLLCKFS